LVDLARQADGTLKRVLCADLVKAVMGLRELEMDKPLALHAAVSQI
jgi:hypothetical protein